VGSGSPELWIVAGVHGNENEGIACVDDALDQLEPARGTLVGVPVAHPAALRAGTRRGTDDVDLNRVYPGTADGGQSERVAHELWSRIEGHADAVLTFHSWHAAGATTPYVEHAAGDAEGRAFAHALGIPFVEAWEWPHGLLPAVATRAGIVSAELELGGLGAQTPAMLGVGMAAVAGAMSHLGMRAPASPAGGRDVRRHTLAAEREGRVRQLVALGSEIAAGAPVAELRALDGSVLETLASPCDGWLAIHNTYGFAEADGAVAIVFEAA
jgi:predicted deacylase